MTEQKQQPGFFDELPPIPEHLAQRNAAIPTEPKALKYPDGLTDAIKTEFLEKIKAAAESTEPFILTEHNLGAWSPSKVKAFQKCQWQFFLKYILKIRIPEELQTQSDPTSAQVGKAGHKILELVMVGKKVEIAYAKTRAEYVDEKKLLTAEQWTELVESLRYNIDNFAERIENFDRATKIKRVLTEFEIAVDKDYNPVSFFSPDAWLRGVVDLILWLENGDIVILDHKTGGGEGSPKVYKFQLDWYKILFHFGMGPIGGAQTGIHFIRAGDVKMVDFSDAREIENNLKNTLEMAIEGAIDNVKEKGFFKHVRGSYCKWCEYDNIGCKSGEHKPIELGTKKWFAIKPI